MDVFVAKVVEDKGDRVILEVPKSLDGHFDIQGGEQFHTIVFVTKDGAWNPFEGEKVQ